MKTFAYICLVIVAASLIFGVSASAQQNYVYSAGSPTFSTTIPIQNGFINISNGNLHLEFGVANHPQRGALSLNERMVYDSKFWTIGHYSNYYWWPDNVTRSTQLAAGWRFVTGADAGTTVVSQNTNMYQCGSIDRYGEAYAYDTQYRYDWQDPSGTRHAFNATLSTHTSDCEDYTDPTPETVSSRALDGSGYEITLVGDDKNGPQNVYVKDPSGNQVYPTMIDRYGNYWSSDSNGNLIDDRGQTPVIRTDNGNTIDFAVLAANGNRVHYIVTTRTVEIHTAFNEYPVNQWNGTLTAVQSIQLPDGSSYSFDYDSGSNSGRYGEMTSMTLPTGGTIQFGWNNFFDSYQNDNRWLTSYQVGNDPSTTFSPQVLTQCSSSGTGCQEQVKLHRPSGDEVQYTLTLNNGAWNTSTDVYSGAASNNNKLTSTATSYDFTQACTAGCSGAQYVQKQNSTTTLVDVGLKSTTQYTYNDPSTGKPSSIKKYDFYSGSLPSAPLTEEQFLYTGFDLTSDKVLDGASNPVSQTVYHYGSNATATTGVVSHGTANAGGPYLTSVDHWIGGSSGSLTTSFVRDDTGALTSSTDLDGTITYGHDATDAFVTSTTLPSPYGIPLSTSLTPSAYTGEVTQTTGLNGEQTNMSFDSLGRPYQVSAPNGGTTTYQYFSANDTGTSTTLSSSVSSQVRTLRDPFGRAERTATYNGQSPNAWYQQDTCYDANGRVYTTSTPYQGQGYLTAKTCSGTTYTYDALDRPSSVQNADGTVNFVYRGRATSVTDVNGVQKITQVDGLGRITDVCEVSPSSNNLPGRETCALDIAASGYLTHYAYNLAAFQTVVSQGQQSRTFTTDALGRKVSTTEPERGTTSYQYTQTSAGLRVLRTRPKANQSNPSVLTTTMMQYDAVGRLRKINYDDGLTPNKIFYFDRQDYTPSFPQGVTNGVGRLVGTATVPPGTTTTPASQYAYDVMGNVTTMWQCAPSICATSNQNSRPALQFGYDLAGNLTYEFDGASGGISYGRSPAGEITSVYNNSYQDQYNPANIVSNVTNGPFGATNYSLGNGTSVVQSFDSLGRIYGGWLCSGNGGQGSPAFCSGNTQMYGYTTNKSGSRVTGMCDTVIDQCQGHAYDEFNRLTGIAGWNSSYTYTYDRYGNRTQQTSSPSGPAPGFSFDPGNNRIQGLAYDAAGNLLNDGFHSYTYDAEGNLVSVDNGSTAKYAYDAMNNRVRVETPSSTYEYLFDPANRRMSSWLLTGSGGGFGNEGRVWMDGKLVATRDWNGQTYYHHSDWLGTERMRTNYQGQNANVMRSLAFGDGYSQSSSDIYGAAQDNNEFAGMDLDYETGTDHAQFRQYSAGQGRWMSPDPYDGSYDPGNPQSFNRYAYVLNNPLSLTDPSGLQYCMGGSPTSSGYNPVTGQTGGASDLTTPGGCSSAGGVWCYFDSCVVATGPQPVAPGPGSPGQVPTGGGPTGGSTNDPDQARINSLVNQIAQNTSGFPNVCSMSFSARGQIPFTPVKAGFSVNQLGNVSGSASFKQAGGQGSPSLSLTGRANSSGAAEAQQISIPIPGLPSVSFTVGINPFGGRKSYGLSIDLGKGFTASAAFTFGTIGDPSCQVR